MRETHGESISFTAWTNSGEYQFVNVAICLFGGRGICVYYSVLSNCIVSKGTHGHIQKYLQIKARRSMQSRLCLITFGISQKIGQGQRGVYCK